MPKNTKILSKTNPKYWEAKVFHTRSRGKSLAGFSVRLQHEGQRHALILDATTKEAAGTEARDLYLRLKANGWPQLLTDYKPPSGNGKLKVTTEEAPAVRGYVERPTVGHLIREAKDLLNVREKTFESYEKSLRTIVSQIFGLHPQRKYAKGKSAQQWRDRVDKVPLDKIKPSDVLKWKNQRLREHNGDPVKKRNTINTVNTAMRGAKALYGKKIYSFLREKMNLPSPMPFDGVSLERAPSMRYQSKICAEDLLKSAKTELAETSPEQFKIFLLALICGLRKGEIDCLRWDAFDFRRQILRIENTVDHELKSEDSMGEIDLDGPTAAFFQEQAKRATGKFVIHGRSEVTGRGRKTRSYRCDWHFNELYTWLRIKGVTSGHPLHELRKEVGSIIANTMGIFEASRYLRHSDVRITSQYYTDKKKIITPGLGGLLNVSVKQEETPDAEEESPALNVLKMSA